MINNKISIIILTISVYVTLFFICGQADKQVESSSSLFKRIMRRSAPHGDHHSMMHNHMSRKVFDRACAASKDTIDDIIDCLHNNEHMMNAMKSDIAGTCYKDSFGVDFDPKDTAKHKDLVCNNRDKFENMTSCAYRKTAESFSTKEIEKLTESMVDVGLCIVNAIDG